jgi:hypothetical protein
MALWGIVQNEFNLPPYAWYPAFMKRHYERLAVTTRPEVANYAKYPAVNWFTFYSLRSALRARGFNRFLDRLDMIVLRIGDGPKGKIAKMLKYVPLSRLGLQCFTPSSVILASKATRALSIGILRFFLGTQGVRTCDALHRLLADVAADA